MEIEELLSNSCCDVSSLKEEGNEEEAIYIVKNNNNNNKWYNLHNLEKLIITNYTFCYKVSKNNKENKGEK